MEKENNLTRLREERGMTQKEVAEELDVTRQAVSQWERGAAMPSMEKLLALSRLYGVAPEKLYWSDTAEKTEEPEPPPEEQPQEEPPPEEQPPETEAGDTPERRWPRKRTVLLILLGVVYLTVYLWGVLTGSLATAKINMIHITLFIIVGQVLYQLTHIAVNLRNIAKELRDRKEHEK